MPSGVGVGVGVKVGVGVGVDVGGLVGAGVKVHVGVAVAAGTGVDVGGSGGLGSDGLGVDVGLRRVGKACMSAGGAALGAARAGSAEKAMLKATIAINASNQKAPFVCARSPKPVSFVPVGYDKVTVSIYPFYTI
jgi:hypothetical protein